jgi:hypothetical protein
MWELFTVNKENVPIRKTSKHENMSSYFETPHRTQPSKWWLIGEINPLKKLNLAINTIISACGGRFRLICALSMKKFTGLCYHRSN